MPNSVLRSALDAKRADHECIALRLALAKAEIKSSERHLAFLSTMHSQHVGAHAVSEAHIDILDQILGGRCIEDVEGSKQHYEAVRVDELAGLAVLEAHMGQMHDVICPRVSHWLGHDGTVIKSGSESCGDTEDSDSESDEYGE